MSQINSGRVRVTNGSSLVYSSQGFPIDLTNLNISEDPVFISIPTIDVSQRYTVVSKNYNSTIPDGLGANYVGWEFTLNRAYEGATEEIQYSITVDFTPNLGLPLVQKGDVDTASLWRMCMQILDESSQAAVVQQARDGYLTVFHRIVTSSDITNGFFTVPNNIEEVQNTVLFKQGSGYLFNALAVGDTPSAGADYTILNTTELHINNNGSASGLAGTISQGDVLMLTYERKFGLSGGLLKLM